MPEESQVLQSLITDEMRRVVGVESEPALIEIEKDLLRRVDHLLGQNFMQWSSQANANSTSYDNTVAFPIILHPTVRSNPLPEYESPYGGGVPVEDEWEFYKPVRPGDTLAMTVKIKDFTERLGRSGQVLVVRTETTFRNQRGHIAMIARRTLLRYPRKGET